MSIFNVFDVVGSAMGAQSVRLNVTASNLANADVLASSPETAYRSRQPVFSTVMDSLDGDMTVGGVRVLDVIQSTTPGSRRFEPENPLSDSEGYVHTSNVNPIAEMANMMSASRSYQSGIEVLNTSKEMLLRTLTLGQ